ncbi:MAG: hypothetical protein RLY86_833 [Pseudomonadota bacterium]|jgi:putative ABC transport system ATP-binding protein
MTARTAPAAATAPSRPPLIALRGITKRYGDGTAGFLALRGVDLDIPAGAFAAIMGASGSGKSTTMNIIACLDRPTTGSYRFLGLPLHDLDSGEQARFRRRNLGFVFQGYNLLPRTTALENVELPLIYRGLAAAPRRAAAREALDQVGLAAWADHTPAELSGGQQQRVAIARAIVTAPRLLVADEPTGNLDSARSREIMDLLTRLNRDRGITIVMVTHEPDMAAYADTIVHVQDGRVQRVDSPAAQGAQGGPP